jgi:hypothetical protein
MFSQLSGDKNHFFTVFPSTAAWHCTCHRLEFGASGAADEDIEHYHLHTGCPRRNVQYFRRVFLMLNYTDITQNTYIQS